jgi:hypothetical protein
MEVIKVLLHADGKRTRLRLEPRAVTEKPPHACLHPTKDDVWNLVAAVLNSTLSDGDLVGIAMRGLGGKANPSVVAAMIRELRAEVPQSHQAARVEMVAEMLKGLPLRYCNCKPDCDVVIERYPPLITPEQALKVLDIASLDPPEGA